MKYKLDREWFLRNRANFISWARILLCAFLLWPIFCHPEWLLTVIFPLMVIAASTDKLDGFLARRWGIVSELGGMLDRIGDKCFALDVCAFLIADGRINISLKILSVPVAVIETALSVYLFNGVKKGMDVSTIKVKGKYGPGQIKMFLLSIASNLCLLNIIVEEHFGNGYHVWATVFLNLMFASSIYFGVKSFLSHHAKNRAYQA